MSRLHSSYDREILRLSVLALGSLAAEPLYVLADTAIVGHLGRSQLAALGISAIVLSGTFALFNFLTYGTTAQVARASGADEIDTAHGLGVQALWLSLAVGVGLAVLIAALAEPLTAAVGGDGKTADYAVLYMRIAVIGLPFAFVARGGEGYLRGLSNLRTPLVIFISANVLNIVLEVLFVYGFDWGIAGSAWGTVVAQVAMGVAFVVVMWPGLRDRLGIDRRLMQRLLTLGRHIFIRTASLYAALVVAGAVAARFGDASLAAHQIAAQLWIFLALVLDAVAIAGQVIVGRMLGAGDREGAYDASVRMIWMSVAAGALFGVVMLALIDVLPRVFTGDAETLDRTRALWPIFALMQPLNGAVFALDGILIGAADGRYIAWSMLAAGATSCAVALSALHFDWGVEGVWAAIAVLILVRLVLMGHRFLGRRWLVTGWAT